LVGPIQQNGSRGMARGGRGCSFSATEGVAYFLVATCVCSEAPLLAWFFETLRSAGTPWGPTAVVIMIDIRESQ
jgi:hypothetical protein